MPERGVAASSCAHIEAEVGEHAAHAADPQFHIVFDGTERRHLTAFDLIERRLQADEDVVDALDLRELVRPRIDDRRGSGFQPGFAIRRRHENHGVVDRRGFWQAGRACIGGRGAARRLDRSGDRRIGDRAQRGRAGFQGGLAPHDLIELLVELLLIEQLPAGGAIDLGAQFGDAVFIGVLHVRLSRDQSRQHVVAEREIGGGRGGPCAQYRDRPDHDPEHHGSEPHLLAGVDDGVAVLRGLQLGSGLRGHRPPGMRPSVIMRMVLRNLGILTRTIRHRHSRAGRKQHPFGSICGVI